VHVRVEENRFKVSLDGAWLFTAYDSAWRSRRLAVWTKPGSPARFDTIAVTPIGRSNWITRRVDSFRAHGI
jgi:hypothetical protein